MNNVEAYQKENPLDARRREPSSEYCNVIVTDGSSKNGRWWYWMLEGEELFCKVRRNDFGEVTDFYPCRLTRAFIEIGRSIRPEDCVII